MTARPASPAASPAAAPSGSWKGPAARPSTAQRLATPFLAVGAALTTWALASAAAPVELVSTGGAVEPVSAAAVLGASAAAALAGWGVLALLERFAGHRARTVWLIGAGLLLAASAVPLVTPGDTAAGTRAALAAVHLVVFAVVVLGLLHPLGRRSGGRASIRTTGGR